MSDRSGISWTDATWNPVTGCTKVSAGCDHCYAETFAERWRGTPGHPYQAGFDLTLRPERLDQPVRWTRPRRVFVNSMSDLFHDGIPDAYIARVFAAMAAAPQHVFQILTKRHGRMRALLSDEALPGYVELEARHLRPGRSWGAGDEMPWPLPNVWLGVSAETQRWAEIRILALLDTPAAIRWVSAEPLLGPIDLSDLGGINGLDKDWTGGPTGGTGAPHPLLDWVVVGGESGAGARPMSPDWLRALHAQCDAAGVAFFAKQAGSVLARSWGLPGKGADPARWPEPMPQQYPDAGLVAR